MLFDQGQWLLTMELVCGVDIVAYTRGANAMASPRPVAIGLASPVDETLQPAQPAARVSGPHLSRGGSLSEARVRAAFAQLAEGLNALHTANKIHRDVKPSNVLVDAKGRVVVLDFGLVTDLGAAGSVEHEYLLGTPRYMAPEQAALQSVSRASDWYSVGVMLYEALTGRTPAVGSRDRLSAAERRARALAPRQLNDQLPAELSELCMELLAPAPEARPSGETVLARIAPKHGRRAALSVPFATASDSIFVGREPRRSRRSTTRWREFATSSRSPSWSRPSPESAKRHSCSASSTRFAPARSRCCASWGVVSSASHCRTRRSTV